MPADGILRTASGFAYRVTDTDKIWLARAAKYEGRGDAVFTIWSLAQRFAEIHGPRFPTLKSVVLAYSQPVNPIWARTGSMCAPGGEYAGTDYCAPSRLDVRDRAARDPSPETLPIVEAWVRGEIPNPIPRGSEFAAPDVAQGCLERGQCVRVVKASENWYLTTRTTEGWPRSFVTISGTGESLPWGALLGAAAAAVGLGLGVAAFASRPKRRRRRRG